MAFRMEVQSLPFGILSWCRFQICHSWPGIVCEGLGLGFRGFTQHRMIWTENRSSGFECGGALLPGYLGCSSLGLGLGVTELFFFCSWPLGLLWQAIG